MQTLSALNQPQCDFPHLHRHSSTPFISFNSFSKTQFSSMPKNEKNRIFPTSNCSVIGIKHRGQLLISVAAALSEASDSIGNHEEDVGMAAKGSGTTARGRRLLKVREEKRKREYDRLHNYPAWAKVLEDACQNDTELRAVLGDSIGNPELMRKRVEERVRKKGRDFGKSKTGSVLAFKVSFRE